MNRLLWISTAVGASLFAAAAGAADHTAAAVGAQTRAWVKLQESPSGKAAVRGLPGEAADRVYQRYLQSFTRPIPERFERDRAGEAQK